MKERLALEADEFVFNRRGELTTYINHDPGEQYVVGADVAMGVRNGDYSVAQILDSKKRQVATWRGQVHPDYFVEVLYALELITMKHLSVLRIIHTAYLPAQDWVRIWRTQTSTQKSSTTR